MREETNTRYVCVRVWGREIEIDKKYNLCVCERGGSSSMIHEGGYESTNNSEKCM